MQNGLFRFGRSLASHASIPASEKAALNLHDNLIRLSVGIEDKEDLIEDLAQALNSIDKL